MNTLKKEDFTPDESAHLHALESLTIIRETIARSTSFTAVPGWGMVGMGVIATIGAWVATWDRSIDVWFTVWFFVAVVACSFGVLCMFYKAERVGVPVIKGSGRQFLMHFTPAILAGCVVTEVLYELNMPQFMPGLWLLLYGVGVVSAGAFSVPVVPLMGVAFMFLGTMCTAATLWLAPIQLGTFLLEDIMLAVGFGGLHIICGLVIARRYGG